MSDKTVLKFIEACKSNKIMATTAESCTGGMIAAAITDIAGTSVIFDRAFVTYSNEAKMEMIGVRKETLTSYGAVSEETAIEMAAGAIENSNAGIALSVTGIAGPDGGTEEKPIGLVWFGVAVKGKPPRAEKRIFENLGRDYIRRETVLTALQLGISELAN